MYQYRISLEQSLRIFSAHQLLMMLAEMLQNLITENTRIAQDQKEYQEKYSALAERYAYAKSEFE